MSRPALLLYIAIVALGSAWMIALAFQSPGTPLHDEITHYFIARDSWANPVHVLDVWGRPGNTLFYMLPSLISIGARRWWALATCVIVVLIATRSAARLGLRQLWLVPLALFLQPWFDRLGFTSITQIPFMLALTVGVDQWIAGRRGWASLCFGLLPLIRHEGLVLTAAWVGYLVLIWQPFVRLPGLDKTLSWQRLLMGFVITLMPMIIWNILHYLAFGRPASGNLLEVRPTDIYGSGDWFHFVLPLIGSVGPVIFGLAMIGVWVCWRNKRLALLYMFAALLYFITHTLIYRFGLFASGGYIIFLLPMAPAFTILAAFAIERIITWFTHASAQVPQRRAALAFAGVLMAAAFLFNLVVVLTTPPWRLQANEVAAEEAAEYLVANGYTDTPVYATHAWFFYVYENRGDLIRVPGGSDMKADDIPPNAFVLWDTQYGDLNSVDLAVLEAPNNGFTEVQRFYDDQLILFRKDD